MNEQEQFDVLDIITLISFAIAIMNLDENRSQSDGISKILNEIQDHLHTQDELLYKLSEHLKQQDELIERRNDNES